MVKKVNSSRTLPTNEGSMNGINTIIGKNETFLDRNAKLIPSDETTTAITNMNWIAGHHTVSTVNDLYNIPDFILSQECYGSNVGDGNDALGQLWYVDNKSIVDTNNKPIEGTIYMLVNWKERGNAKGWSKTNIKPLISTSGEINVSYFNTNKEHNLLDTYTKWISSVTIYGDGTYTYTADGIHLNKSISTKTYTSAESNTTFDVIDSINYNPTKEKPFQISYNVKTVKVLSQNHHGGEFSNDFLTSASLSSTGTLSGTGGKFSTSYSFDNSYHGMSKSSEKILDTNHIGNGATIVTNVYLGHNGELHASYVVPRNWMHDDIVSKNDKNNTWVEYHENGDLKTTYLPKASKDKTGVYTAYTYGFVDDYLKDIEDRLTRKEVTYLIQNPTVKCSWKIMDATNTKEIISIPENTTSITVERGSNVTLSNVSISWPSTKEYMVAKSTNGVWGTNLDVSIKNNGTEYQTNGAKSFPVKQITLPWDNTYIYPVNQQLTGIEVYGVKKFITKKDSAGDTIVIKKEAENKTATTPEVSITVKATYPIDTGWYGFVNEDPLTWGNLNGEEMLKKMQNLIATMKMDGKPCFKVIQNKAGAPIKFTDSTDFPLVNNTLDKPKYFVYIYNRFKGDTKLSKAIKGGADAISGAFAFNNQITVTINSRTNNYPSEFTVLRSIDSNQTDLTGTFVEFQ